MYILYPNVRLLVIVLHVWCPRGPRLFTYYVSCIGAIIRGTRARAHPVRAKITRSWSVSGVFGHALSIPGLALCDLVRARVALCVPRGFLYSALCVRLMHTTSVAELESNEASTSSKSAGRSSAGLESKVNWNEEDDEGDLVEVLPHCRWQGAKKTILEEVDEIRGLNDRLWLFLGKR